MIQIFCVEPHNTIQTIRAFIIAQLFNFYHIFSKIIIENSNDEVQMQVFS